MKVVVCDCGLNAKDEKGNVYEIESLIIVKQNERNDTIRVPYTPDTHFFKTACPKNTEHVANLLPNGKINVM